MEMELLRGIQYNFKGLILGLRTPKLLFLGLLRFFIVIFFSLVLSGVALYWHQDILNLIWTRPESQWLFLAWKLVSWCLSLFLVILSSFIAYFAAQIIFSIFIMDYMSVITEQIVTGKTASSSNLSFAAMFVHLLKQEIPRAILPLIVIVFISMAGFLTPFGSIIAILSSLAAAVILAWDNTDLIPARQMVPFRKRFGFLKKNFLFHLGFGLWFLVPWLNIFFLSFAPVGGALYYLEEQTIITLQPE